MKKITVVLIFIILTFSFTKITGSSLKDEPEYIPASVQRTGNAAKGYIYLTTGNYIKSGLPYTLFAMATGKDSNNFLQRSGINKNIPYDFTAVKASNGEQIVAPNCLQCHAQMFEGKLVTGLGNSFSDFTVNRSTTAILAEKFLKNMGAANVKKYDAAKSFITSLKAVSPALIASTKGVNLADALAAMLVAHRQPLTLQWSDESLIKTPQEIIPTDVPAWWLLKKKHAMFYNGFGRGDFGRFLMASNLLTVSDTMEAAEVDSHFNDVLAYINSIEAPKFPKQINEGLAAQGKIIFANTCASCHGNYEGVKKYPNLLIPQKIIQTDPALFSANYSSPQFVDWFNKSWFTTGDHPAKLVPYKGYIAPPLDGVWITAPYLHNGAVPTLAALLNSKIRPKYWQRNFSRQDYNYESPGWNYDEKTSPGGTDVYNTTLKGYSNSGHYFADKLSERERTAVIEYLKKL